MGSRMRNPTGVAAPQQQGAVPNMMGQAPQETVPNLHMPNLNRQQQAPDYRQYRIDQVLGRGQFAQDGQAPDMHVMPHQGFGRRFRGGGY